MDPFESKQLTADQLTSVTEMVKEMKKLSVGNGHKKDATVSKIKDPEVKALVMSKADALEAEVKDLFPELPILVLLEVARRFRKEYEDIARERIPTMLTDIGLSSLSLSTGETLEVKDKIEASISDKNYLLARNNMIKTELKDRLENNPFEGVEEDHMDGAMEDLMMEVTDSIDALFTKQLVISDPSEELKANLLEMGVMYDNKYAIHWMTLRKYCAEQRAQGKEIPDGISVYEYSEATLK